MLFVTNVCTTFILVVKEVLSVPTNSLLIKGTFKELISPLPDYQLGAVQKLDIGDLICYAKGSDIDHFAIITGFDSNGYPLVNTHTIDRYHVPWDLGWGDKNIKFYLIHAR